MREGEPVSSGSAKSAKHEKRTAKSEKKSNIRWAVTILLLSFVLSFVFNALSDLVLQGVGLAIAFCVLAAFVLLGIVFDILGVATTSASMSPLHAMAAHKVNGAREAIWLLQNTEKVSSFCNDVIGDIAGIISGATAAVIIAKLPFQNIWLSLGITALVAGLTVGGKAFGKSFAINHSNSIVFCVGRFLYFFKHMFSKKR